MKAASKQVLAVGHVGVPLCLVGGVPEALVDPTLEEDQAAQPVALDLEVAWVREPLLETVVVIRPNVLDLEWACAAL